MSSDVTTPSSRDRVLALARVEFAERGFGGARLQDIARAAGLSHPTLLYHFGSKADLYRAVLADAAADFQRETEAAIEPRLLGFDQVASLVEAGFRFFETHGDFVRILRREAIEGGAGLDASIMRPFVTRAVMFLEREMAAGRLRDHDPIEVMQILYGAVFTYFSDARFRERLTGVDPLSSEALDRHRSALIGLLRTALEPVDD